MNSMLVQIILAAVLTFTLSSAHADSLAGFFTVAESAASYTVAAKSTRDKKGTKSRKGKSDKSDKSDKSGKSDKSDKSGKSEKNSKSTKSGKSDKSDKSDKSKKSGKSDKSSKSKKSCKSKKGQDGCGDGPPPVPTTDICLLNTTSGVYELQTVPLADVEGYTEQNLVGAIKMRWRDADGDGWGDPNQFIETCEEIDGWVRNGSDDDDTIPAGPVEN